MKRIVYILVAGLLLSSCTSVEKSTSTTDTNDVKRKKSACGNLHVDMEVPHLDWFEENKSILNKSKEVLVLPKDYKVYTIDTTQLHNFFEALENKQNVATVVPLPKPAACQLFKIKPYKDERTTSVVPDAITGIGEAQGQKMVIGYSKSKGLIDAHIDWFEIAYKVTTVMIENRPYFIVYEKVYTLPQPDLTKQQKEPPRLIIDKPMYTK